MNYGMKLLMCLAAVSGATAQVCGDDAAPSCSAAATTRRLEMTEHGEFSRVVQVNEAAPLRKLGREDIRVRTEAAALNPSDEYYIGGFYGPQGAARTPNAFPAGVGVESCGTVEARGADVEKLRVGDKVYVARIFPECGAYAEHQVVNGNGGVASEVVVRLPSSMPCTVGTQLFVNPMSALGMLIDLEAEGLKEGDALVVTAATSALARFLILGAKKRGVRVIGVVRREEQRAPLLALGATAVVVQAAADAEDGGAALAQRIRTAVAENGGGAVKYAIDAVGGGPTARAVVRSLDLHGTVLVYGILDQRPFHIDTDLLLFNTLTVRGWHLDQFLARHGPAAALDEVLQTLKAADDAVEDLLPTKAFDMFDEHLDAFAHHKAPGQKAKTVFTVKPFDYEQKKIVD